ncbi:MAG: histidinol-phosphatase [Robiginitomaculum sp.]|nr:MAG: histidinol-phosphatase [Robiginitomaculum sp.]
MKTDRLAPHIDALNQRLAIACNMAQAARAITLPAFHTDIQAQDKSADIAGADEFDPVTAADIAAEKCLRGFIETHFPDDGIIGEEMADKPANNEWSWCLDPIDGTRGFVAGVPLWSTLIAVCYDGKPVIGIIDIPALSERYIGTHTHSESKAWKETPQGSTPLRTRPCLRINDAIIGCTEPMTMFSLGQKAAYEMIRRTARFSRLGLDAYGYALVASGRMDIILEASMKPYDILALIPVIEGAGGKITNWHGGQGFDDGSVICSGDPDLLDHVYPYLKRVLD